MTTRDDGWGTVGLLLLFASLACIFAFNPVMTVYSMGVLLLLDRERLFLQDVPRIGSILAWNTLMLATAVACGYTCIRRLDGRSVGWWAVGSLAAATVTIIATGMYSPRFWFRGI